jgi:hypothetical protein
MTATLTDLLSRLQYYVANFRNQDPLVKAQGDPVSDADLDAANALKLFLFDALKPISSILTVDNTDQARVKAAAHALLVLPDTRGFNQQSTNYALALAEFLDSWVAYQIVPIPTGGFMGILVHNNIALRANQNPVACPPCVLLTEAEIHAGWVAMQPFEDHLRRLAHNAPPLQFLAPNPQGDPVDPVIMRGLDQLGKAGPAGLGSPLTGPLTPEETQFQKMALKDLHRTAQSKTMYDPALFDEYFGVFPTMNKGLLAIMSNTSTLIPGLGFSTLQLEHLATGLFGSFLGKQRSGHTSITHFGPQNKITSVQDLHSAIHRLQKIALSIFGSHILEAINRFREFMFSNLEPLNATPGTPSRLSVTQVIDLFNLCLFSVGNSSQAIHALTPLDRWNEGFSSVLNDSAKINIMASAHMATLLASCAPSTASATTESTSPNKRHQSEPSASPKKKQRKPTGKQKNKSKTDSSECHFFSAGNCRRGSKCPFLHNGTPAGQHSEDSDSGDDDK